MILLQNPSCGPFRNLQGQFSLGHRLGSFRFLSFGCFRLFWDFFSLEDRLFGWNFGRIFYCVVFAESEALFKIRTGIAVVKLFIWLWLDLLGPPRFLLVRFVIPVSLQPFFIRYKRH